MTTSIEHAFVAALKNQKLPGHLHRVGEIYYTDPLINEWWGAGDKIIPVPDSEIVWLDGGYVHACAIPTGYLEQRAEVAGLHQRTVTSHMRFAGKTRAETEGYIAKAEFATGMMREHLQDTASISAMVSETAMVDDKLVRYGHIPPANNTKVANYRLTDDAIAKRKAAYLAAHPEPHRPRVFEMSRLVETPDELIDTEAYDRDIAAALRNLIGLSDWDPAMAYGQLKQWDQQTLIYETLRMSTIDYAKTVTDEIAMLYRTADAQGDEIPRAQVERLNEKLQGLRMQVFDYSRRYKTCLVERDRAVRQSGINFPAYLSLEQRKTTAQARHRARRLAATEVDRLNAMTPEDRIKALKAVARSGVADYRPRTDGVAEGGPERRVEGPLRPGEEA